MILHLFTSFSPLFLIIFLFSHQFPLDYSATPYTPPLLSSPSTDLLKQSPSVNSDRAGFFLQFYILLIRTWRNRLLGRTALFVDLVQALAMALVVGAVFLNLGHDQVSVQDRYGLFYIISTMYPFMLVLSTVSKRTKNRYLCLFL